MAMNNLHHVMLDLMKDTYHAEKQLVKALPKMAKAAATDELITAFENHLRETQTHVKRLEDAFKMFDMVPKAKTCHGMMGLIEEGSEVIDEKDDGEPSAIDSALIAAAQKVEHYEITAYGTLSTFAKALGLDDLAELFDATLAEEEEADKTLSEIAESTVNPAAIAAGSEQDEEGEESRRSSRVQSSGSRSRA